MDTYSLFIYLRCWWGANGCTNLSKKVDDTIELYKTHRVAKGYHQQPDVDLEEAFSVVVKYKQMWVVGLIDMSKELMKNTKFNKNMN